MQEYNESWIGGEQITELDDLRYAAISALSNIVDNRIHELAQQLFHHKDWQKAATGIKLLVSNYCQGDNETIEDVLKRISESADKEEIHTVVFDLGDICENNNSKELTKILILRKFALYALQM